MYEDTSL